MTLRSIPQNYGIRLTVVAVQPDLPSQKALSVEGYNLFGMKTVCPKCGSSKGIREYIYGMPAGPVDESKFEIGGCTEGFAKDSPTHKCINCDWEGIQEA